MSLNCRSKSFPLEFDVLKTSIFALRTSNSAGQLLADSSSAETPCLNSIQVAQPIRLQHLPWYTSRILLI